METRLYMTVTLKDGSLLRGAGGKEGRDRIPLRGFDHHISMRAAGARGHGKLRIQKALDWSSPRLTQAMCKGEELPDVRIDWYEVDEDGTETLFFRHLLQAARIVNVQQGFLPEAGGISVEELDLRYRKITWSHMPTKRETEDMWTETSDPQS